MQRLDVARVLEYLDLALQEAEAAAQWYAERSPHAALAFSEELDAAEIAITQLQKRIRALITARDGTCFAVFHLESSIASKRLG